MYFECYGCCPCDIPEKKNECEQGRTQGGGVKTTPLNLLCYKNVITYAKEFVYVFVRFLLV